MTQLSPNFSLDEFLTSDTAIQLGIKNTASPPIVARLKIVAAGMETVRALLNARNPAKNWAIRVNSAYRNPAVNRAVGGVANSDHALGWAVDFVCPGFGNPLEIALAIRDSGIRYDQLIHEKKPNGAWWVHISFNPRMRQQDLTYNGKNYSPGITPVR